MHLNVVQYFWDKNTDIIKEKSLANCHCFGLDSIVLDDSPGAMIRMFFANKNHDLWKNEGISQNLSVAIHPHHCDLTIISLFGRFTNIGFTTKRNTFLNPYIFNKFLYSSKITKNKTKFKYLGKSKLFVKTIETFSKDDGKILHLEAADLHTVFVKKGETAAWIVYEGKENPNYKPICYSNKNLINFNDEKLYQKQPLRYWFDTLRVIYPELKFCRNRI